MVNYFDLIIEWLRYEREVYQTQKFDYEEESTKVHDHDYWIQQFDSYIQRLPVFGLETLQGAQAALKLAATAIALCEHLAETGALPKPSIPSGNIEVWDKSING